MLVRVMDTNNTVTAGRRTPLVIAAATAAVLLVANVLWWIRVSGAESTHPERVERHLDSLPLAIGRLGATGVTWLCIAAGVAGFTCAAVAMSRARQRVVPGILAVVNGLVTGWLLFTLM